MIILIKLIYWSVPLGLFIWSIFNLTTATWSFIAIATVFEGYLYFLDIFTKPSPDPERWNREEIELIRKYHVALRFPFGAREMSNILNGFRFTAFLWVPWLLWNQMWGFAVFFVLNFLFTGSLAVRLDPFYFLSDAVNRGKYQFASELSLLEEVAEKLRGSR